MANMLSIAEEMNLVGPRYNYARVINKSFAFAKSTNEKNDDNLMY